MYNMVAQTWLDSFLLTFVPLFIVIGAMRNLPFVISLNEERTASERDKLIRYALITAVIIGLFFLFVGKFVLQLMGISVGSFAIGGGIILLVLSVNYLLSNEVHIHEKEESLAAVPVGTPLTVGPATITTLLLLGTQFPIYWVLISFALNVAIVWIIFRESNRIIRILGKGGVMGVSKVFSLLLAAVAVNMVIRGLSMINVLHLPP
jgi:multiple antibiotic resistance protein